MRHGAGSSGLSLIEVMISITVLAFVLLAFLGIMHSSSQLSASSEEMRLAIVDLQAAIEDTFAEPFGAAFLSTFPNGFPQPVVSGGETRPNPASHRFAKYWDHSGNRRSLRNERVWMVHRAWGGNTAADPDWLEYEIVLTFTNHKGLPQRESVVLRRSK